MLNPAGDFHGKTALVTGAARGIGAAIARRLAAGGARVGLVDTDEEALAAIAGEINGAVAPKSGGSATSYQGNVTDKSFLDRAVASLKSQSGSVDLLVNNAGIIRDNFVSRITEADWDDVMSVNLKGPFLCCQAVIPAMKEMGGGRIVNISSRSWLGNVGQANYSASKGGVVSLTRTLALELARFNIAVNAVAPGLIDTPMTRSMKEEARQRLIAMQPTGRMGTVDDIAEAVAFLGSIRAAFITGQILHVDGGKSCGLLSL